MSAEELLDLNDRLTERMTPENKIAVLWEWITTQLLALPKRRRADVLAELERRAAYARENIERSVAEHDTGGEG